LKQIPKRIFAVCACCTRGLKGQSKNFGSIAAGNGKMGFGFEKAYLDWANFRIISAE
jgi:hypothetical protein